MKQTKIAYGLKGRKLVYITDVDKGAKCGCVCPACKHPLIARKGPVRTAHFSHKSGSDCKTAAETILHLMAKKIISSSNHINIPAYDFTKKRQSLSGEIFKHSEKIIPGGIVTITNVHIENDGRRGNFIPDLVVEAYSKSLIVEIHVTHKVDRNKLKKIRKNNEPCIEITLKEDDALLPENELRKLLLDITDNKKWLYHPKQKEAEARFYNKIRKINRDKRKKKILLSNLTKQSPKYRSHNPNRSHNPTNSRAAFDRAIYNFVKQYDRAPSIEEGKRIITKLTSNKH